MDSQSIHLMLTHVPVIGSLLATAVLAYGLLRKQEEIVRLSCYLFICAALAAVPVYFSGEGAEEAVEHLPGVAEALIEDHEHLAKLAFGLIEALGLAAVGALLLSFRRLRLPLWGAAALGALALTNSAVLAQTAHLGGQIRHSEIRSGGAGSESHQAEPDGNEAGEGQRAASREADPAEQPESRDRDDERGREDEH